MDLASRSSQDGEVLTGQVNGATVDRGSARHDAVSGDLLACHAEIDLAVLGKQTDLLEALGVDESIDALASGELALLLLLDQAVCTATCSEPLFGRAELG